MYKKEGYLSRGILLLFLLGQPFLLKDISMVFEKNRDRCNIIS